MELVDALQSDSHKLCAGVYALDAGLVFILVAGLMLAPLVHPIMHKFHWAQDQ